MESQLKERRVLILILVNLLLVLAIFEITERSLVRLSPCYRLPFNGWKDEIRYTWGHPVKNNHLGFREKEFTIPKPKDVYRIMVLGDSLTWGVGLSEDQRYSNQLERLLKKEFNQDNYEVLSFARPGDRMTTYLEYLEEYGDQVDPDLIVVGFCINDTQPKKQDYSIEKEQWENKLDPYFTHIDIWLSSYPQIKKRIKGGIWKILTDLGYVPSWGVGLNRTYDKSSVEWKEFETALTGINQYSEKMKMNPPILSILNQGKSNREPTDYAKLIDSNDFLVKWTNQVEQTAKNIGFKTISHVPELIEMGPMVMSVNPCDGHPSADLNKIYAEKLFRVIKKEYLNH